MSGRNWRERGSLAVTFVALAAWSVSAAHPPVRRIASMLLLCRTLSSAAAYHDATISSIIVDSAPIPGHLKYNADSYSFSDMNET